MYTSVLGSFFIEDAGEVEVEVEVTGFLIGSDIANPNRLSFSAVANLPSGSKIHVTDILAVDCGDDAQIVGLKGKRRSSVVISNTRGNLIFFS
jgi:hypothetical protein